MHNLHGVRCIHGIRDLENNCGCFVWGEWRVALGVALEEFPRGPFDRDKVQSLGRLADVECTNDIGMLHTLSEGCLAQESRDGSLVMTQLLAQDLDRDIAMRRMTGPIDGRRSTFTHAVVQRVSGECCSYERVARHRGEPNCHDKRSQAKKRVSCGVEEDDTMHDIRTEV